MSTDIESTAVPNIGPALGLAANERVVWSGLFNFSIVHFFLKTKVALTDRRVAWERPNTFLGVIPLGFQRDTFPLANIASVGSKTAIGVWRFIFGLLLTFFGLAYFVRGGWLTVIIGVLLMMSAFQNAVGVTNTGGQKYYLRISITQAQQAHQFADAVNTAIANRG